MTLKDMLIYTLLACMGRVEAKSKADSAILLSKVKTLTLYGDKQTSHRRISSIPQLTCIGGSGCQHYNVDLMRCQNAGSEYDAEDVQWTCSASLPPEFKLGSTEVVCEGYNNADDPWILKGSCGVEYRLLLTDEGEKKYSSQSKPAYRSKQDGNPSSKASSETWQSTIARILFWVVFVGIVCLIIYRIFVPPNVNGPIRLNGNNRPGWGGGGGGGDNGPFDDPPPPYSPRASPQYRTKPTSSRASTAGSSRGNSGPGFWSGAAAGGAAGYGAGYYQGSRTAEAERRQRERSRERSRERRRETERSSSSWFGSGSRAGSSGAGMGSSSGGGFFGSGGSSPIPSSSQHERTGFGGTRRR